MSAGVSWVLDLIRLVLAGILVNLFSNQLEAWLPSLARRIVRHQARKMRRRSARCEEEWLAHLDETRGALAQLRVAIGTLFVGFFSALETHRDAGGGLRTLFTDYIRDRAAWVIVPVVVLLVIAYPPDPIRHAAYAILIPVLMACAMHLSPPFRRAFVTRYEQLSFTGRVGIGGLVTPAFVYFVIMWNLVPPSWKPPSKAVPQSVSFAPPEAPLVFIVPSLPPDIERPRPTVGTEATPNLARRKNVRRAQQSVSESKQLLPNTSATFIWESPPVLLPEQPLPSPRAAVAMSGPAAPTGLRIVVP